MYVESTQTKYLRFYLRIQIYKLKLMDIQTKNTQQLELQQLFRKTEDIYNQRSQQLLNKLSSLMNQGGQVHFLNHVNLRAAIQCFRSIGSLKERQVAAMTPNEQDINAQIMNQLETENQKLLLQIADLQRENESIKKQKVTYQLAQKHTSKRIANLQERILKEVLVHSKQTPQISLKNNATFNFAYDKASKNKVEFNKSFKYIVDHFLHRISQNEVILKTLQDSIQRQVKESEQKRAKIRQYLAMSKQASLAKTRAGELKRQNEDLKSELRQKVRKVEGEISQRLPGLIDQSIMKIKEKKQAYQKAYHSLLEILNKVVVSADIDKVRDYINQP